MKTTFKYNLQGLTGKMDDKIFYYHPGKREVYVRSYVRAKRNPSAEKMQTVMQNLKLIQPSAAYIRDLKDYLILYNKLRKNQNAKLITWMNLYLKIMFALQKKYSEVDLTTLSREQIYRQQLPCRSVCEAVLAELLPAVRNYHGLTAQL